jgi:hypothetical protein
MITVQFNNVDKTAFVNIDGFRIESVLTSQVDTCQMEVVNFGAHIFKPVISDDVKVFDGTDKIFAGIVTKITENIVEKKIIYSVEVIDYTQLADKKMVAETYSAQTVNDIIADIVTNYLPTFTIANVDCDIVVDYVAFNYEQPSKCFQRLAELTGFDWYIDYDKDIHFFSQEINPAPFNLTDSNGKYIFESLEISRDISQLKNVVFVRGGEYLADFFTENQKGDGIKRDFKTAYKYDGIGVAVNGVVKTVGIDYIDDPTTKDCLYNFQEKVVKFRADNLPGNGITVDISGFPYVPVIVEARDQTSINKYGESWFTIIDKSIKTKQGARERGAGELMTYSEIITECKFQTYEKGLRAGQIINIQSTIRNIDEDYLINKVSAVMLTFDTMQYQVSLVTTKTMGIIEFLQKLLLSDDRKITVGVDEVVDKLWSASEFLPVFSEAITVSHETGPWYTSGVTDPIGFVGFCEAS